MHYSTPSHHFRSRTTQTQQKQFGAHPPCTFPLLQTAKALGKAILALAAEDGGRCGEMGKLLQFLTTHMPILNAQAVAEQLVGKGMCGTEHIATLTGGSLATKWTDGAVSRGWLQG